MKAGNGRFREITNNSRGLILHKNEINGTSYCPCIFLIQWLKAYATPKQSKEKKKRHEIHNYPSIEDHCAPPPPLTHTLSWGRNVSSSRFVSFFYLELRHLCAVKVGRWLLLISLSLEPLCFQTVKSVCSDQGDQVDSLYTTSGRLERAVLPCRI